MLILVISFLFFVKIKKTKFMKLNIKWLSIKLILIQIKFYKLLCQNQMKLEVFIIFKKKNYYIKKVKWKSN